MLIINCLKNKTVDVAGEALHELTLRTGTQIIYMLIKITLSKIIFHHSFN